MGNAKNSVKNSIDGISDLILEIQQYAIEDVPITKKRGARVRTTKSILENLDNAFWDSIRAEVSRMLVANINAIRVMNKPQYAAWKRRARENGYTVRVLENGAADVPVKYIRGGFLTGTIRERVSQVSVEQRKKNQRSVRPDSIEYSIDFSNLRNNYNEIFEKFVTNSGYKDIFSLTEQQLNYILEKIAGRIAQSL